MHAEMQKQNALFTTLAAGAGISKTTDKNSPNLVWLGVIEKVKYIKHHLNQFYW